MGVSGLTSIRSYFSCFVSELSTVCACRHAGQPPHLQPLFSLPRSPPSGLLRTGWPAWFRAPAAPRHGSFPAQNRLGQVFRQEYPVSESSVHCAVGVSIGTKSVGAFFIVLCVHLQTFSSNCVSLCLFHIAYFLLFCLHRMTPHRSPGRHKWNKWNNCRPHSTKSPTSSSKRSEMLILPSARNICPNTSGAHDFYKQLAMPMLSNQSRKSTKRFIGNRTRI